MGSGRNCGSSDENIRVRDNKVLKSVDNYYWGLSLRESELSEKVYRIP
jgi:hypothetical protein